jgi:hypothetical protein
MLTRTTKHKHIKLVNKMSTRKAQPVSRLDHRLDYRGFESHQEQAIFSLLQNAPIGYGAHPAACSIGIVSCLGDKPAGA